MAARLLLALVLFQSIGAEPGITGRVLAHDGPPVTGGTVTLMTSSTSHVDAAIDRDGKFKIVPDGGSRQRLFISVTGHAPYRATLTMPPSRAIALPDITLVEATFFHARFVTAEGEPLAASFLRVQSLDIDGIQIPDPLGMVRERS